MIKVQSFPKQSEVTREKAPQGPLKAPVKPSELERDGLMLFKNLDGKPNELLEILAHDLGDGRKITREDRDISLFFALRYLSKETVASPSAYFSKHVIDLTSKWCTALAVVSNLSGGVEYGKKYGPLTAALSQELETQEHLSRFLRVMTEVNRPEYKTQQGVKLLAQAMIDNFKSKFLGGSQASALYGIS